MATRSTITIINPDKSIRSIYCHWDGQTTHNGKILKEHYNDTASVNELLNLGDLSSLQPNINKCIKLNPQDTESPWTEDYWNSFRLNTEMHQKWNYVFAGNEWQLLENGELIEYYYL